MPTDRPLIHHTRRPFAYCAICETPLMKLEDACCADCVEAPQTAYCPDCCPVDHSAQHDRRNMINMKMD